MIDDHEFELIESEDENELTTFTYISNGLYFEYFVGYELTSLLGYKNVSKTINDNVSKSNKLEFRDYPGVKEPELDPRTILITRDGVIEILLKTRKRISPDVLHILKKFNIDTTNRKCLTKEQQTLSTLTNVFKTEKFEDQYKIGTYYLDLYFSDYKIVIECDENGHADRKPWKERERMNYVNEKLNINDTNWIRFNPDEHDFDIAKVIGRIYRKIDEIKQEAIEKQVKIKEEEYQKLLEKKGEILVENDIKNFNVYSYTEDGVYKEYFVALEIINILGYKYYYDPLRYMVSDENKIKFNDFKGEQNPKLQKHQPLLTRKGVVEILLKTKKPVSTGVINLFKKYSFLISITNNKRKVDDIKEYMGKELYKEMKEEPIVDVKNTKKLNMYSYIDNSVRIDYFIGNEISNLIGYTDINGIKHLTKKNNFMEFYKFPGEKNPNLNLTSLLINREGVKDILMTTTKYLSPLCVEILRNANFYVSIEGRKKTIKCIDDNHIDNELLVIKDTFVVDNNIINKIKNTIKSEKYIENYEVKDKYKIVFYFPEYKIILDYNNDKERFLDINKILRIDESFWIRYDDDSLKTMGEIVEKMKIKGKVVYQTCCRCKVPKELFEYHRNMLNRLKVEYCCKVCRSQKAKESKAKKIIKLEEIKITEKYCSKCENTLEISNFWKSTCMKDGYYKYCKECGKEYIKTEKVKIEAPEFKKCVTCEKMKNKEEFRRNFKNIDRLNETCISCYKISRSRNRIKK